MKQRSPLVRDADVAVQRGVAAWDAPLAVDRALVALSEAADHGKLWFAVAAVLAITGRRRAAVRGTLSLLAASALTNLVGKRVFGGVRPPGPARPSRRAGDMPTSGSFPSGHSASAAAFATGASLESPQVAPILGPLAALVAYSRIHVGAHWFYDVVGGTVIGAIVAMVGAAIFPPRRDS